MKVKLFPNLCVSLIFLCFGFTLVNTDNFMTNILSDKANILVADSDILNGLSKEEVNQFTSDFIWNQRFVIRVAKTAILFATLFLFMTIMYIDAKFNKHPSFEALKDGSSEILVGKEKES
jgi:hypothetical protein